MKGSLFFGLLNLCFFGLRWIRFLKNEAKASFPLLPKMGDTEVIAWPQTPPMVLVLARESALLSSFSNKLIEAEVKPNLFNSL